MKSNIFGGVTHCYHDNGTGVGGMLKSVICIRVRSPIYIAQQNLFEGGLNGVCTVKWNDSFRGSFVLVLNPI